MPEFPYEDIVNLSHPVSSNHTPMPVAARAAQFAPFAALNGHEEAIAETARITDRRRELSAGQLHELSRRLAFAMSFAGRPEVAITFFRRDPRKDGGSYVSVTGRIKRVEEAYNLLILTDGTEIPLDAVSDISGEIFNDME